MLSILLNIFIYHQLLDGGVHLYSIRFSCSFGAKSKELLISTPTKKFPKSTKHDLEKNCFYDSKGRNNSLTLS